MQAIYVRKRRWRWQREGQRERERNGGRMKRELKERDRLQSKRGQDYENMFRTYW